MGDRCTPSRCTCSHSEDAGGDLFNLFYKIDLENVSCLNELEKDSGRKVLRTWEERLKPDVVVQSDVDEELLFNIPFTGLVRLRKLCVIGFNDSSFPKKLKLFNVKLKRPLEFEDTGRMEPDQVVDLAVDTDGSIHYPLKQTKFQNLSHLCLHVSDNLGDDTTVIRYIGLQGDYLRDFREEVTVTNYELAPNPADHRVKQNEFMSQHIS